MDIQTFKRLYNDYTKKYIPKILIAIFFSLLVAGSTSSIAYLLDPAIKKIFIDKDQTLIYLIPFAIIVTLESVFFKIYLVKIAITSSASALGYENKLQLCCLIKSGINVLYV